jgi:uncharacterized small protein (DUF1192 family)
LAFTGEITELDNRIAILVDERDPARILISA